MNIDQQIKEAEQEARCFLNMAQEATESYCEACSKIRQLVAVRGSRQSFQDSPVLEVK